jgi:hypothetical protein
MINENEFIAHIAALTRALDHASGDKVKVLERQIKEARERLEPYQAALVWVAYNLLCGKRCPVYTESPESIARVRSLATHLRATVTEEPHGSGGCFLRIDPPARIGSKIGSKNQSPFTQN